MEKTLSANKIKSWLSDNKEISFIDVREIGQHTEGHPFFSISVPYSIFEYRLLELLPNKNVRVVLFDNNDGIANLAAKQAKLIGYKNIFILENGIDGWLNAGFELFDGINVPSKSFGELVEHKYNTPSINSNELFNKQKQKKDLIILDGRPFQEYEKMSIPGSICCPNAEIPYKISSLVKNTKTEIIVNCAGRTRSIIGAQALINFGVENKVYALENGTQGWFLSDLKLDHGKKNYLDIQPNEEEIKKLNSKIKSLLIDNEIEIINLKKANDLISKKDRSTFIFDVTTKKSLKDKVSFIKNVPGGQLVQATDNFVGVLNSQIILLDEGDLVRSGITALWLKKLNFDCYVLDVKHEEIKNLNFKNNKEYESQTAQKLTLNELKNMRSILIFDIRNSVDFCKSRLKQSTWLNRCNLKDYNNLIKKNVILVCDDLHKLSLIQKDLNIKFPDIDIKVYYWDEIDKDKFSEYFDTSEIQMNKNFIDFNFHTYLRHNGNKEHATQYLKWETGLLNRMDKEETSFFKYF
jgi:rhodanese-related sulfurtransferase